MDDAGVQVRLADWRQRSLAGWPAAAATSNRAARTFSQPKRRSLKIWVGMQAELERGRVVGRGPTWCSTNPLWCVGYRQSVWAGGRGRGRDHWAGEMQRVDEQRGGPPVHGYLTWVAAGGIGDEPGRQAGLTRACVSSGCVDGRTRGCGRVQQQHMRGRHTAVVASNRALLRSWPTVTSTWSSAAPTSSLSQGAAPVP